MTQNVGEKEGGIPSAIFIDDVPAYLEKHNTDIETVIGKFQELHQKYKILELSLARKRTSLMDKIPEIEANLAMVEHLLETTAEADGAAGGSLRAQYELADNIYAMAEIGAPKEVCLWLGANVMVSYTPQEAHDILKENSENASTNLKTVEGDLAFIKQQTTICEVNVARVFNFDVVKRREERLAAGVKVAAN
jgi:prefoldin subunit 5